MQSSKACAVAAVADQTAQAGATRQEFGPGATRYSQGVTGMLDSTSSNPNSSAEAAIQGAVQGPVCQVEGCHANLSGLKEYHRRYHICETHLKTESLERRGELQRFCQQCGRFHSITAFDKSNRSCRTRLLRHNARRRKRKPNDDETATDQSVDEAAGANAPAASSLKSQQDAAVKPKAVIDSGVPTEASVSMAFAGSSASYGNSFSVATADDAAVLEERPSRSSRDSIVSTPVVHDQVWHTDLQQYKFQVPGSHSRRWASSADQNPKVYVPNTVGQMPRPPVRGHGRPVLDLSSVASNRLELRSIQRPAQGEVQDVWGVPNVTVGSAAGFDPYPLETIHPADLEDRRLGVHRWGTCESNSSTYNVTAANTQTSHKSVGTFRQTPDHFAPHLHSVSSTAEIRHPEAISISRLQQALFAHYDAKPGHNQPQDHGRVMDWDISLQGHYTAPSAVNSIAIAAHEAWRAPMESGSRPKLSKPHGGFQLP